MVSKFLDNIKRLFEQYFAEKVKTVKQLPQSGSHRLYFRIESNHFSAIAVYGPQIKENKTYYYLTGKLQKSGIAVPKIYAISEDKQSYLLQDLGNESLFGQLEKNGFHWNEKIEAYYKKALQALVKIQSGLIADLDKSRLYSKAVFDSMAVRWDLEYFKYYFLKAVVPDFDAYALEKDFQKIIDFFQSVPKECFMYRDFQSRNILLYQDQPYFIDFQGGQVGFWQYDLVSLLYQAKANIPQQSRNELTDFYWQELSKVKKISKKEFWEVLDATVLLRTLQVLGAYGFRGFFEKKKHFVESIPFALKNLKQILGDNRHPFEINDLVKILKRMTEKYQDRAKKPNRIIDKKQLAIYIKSFSYLQNGIPQAEDSHGGGFVFDCRALPNPGRFEEYKALTGKDEKVIRFLEQEKKVNDFISNCYDLVKNSVETYLLRGFSSLSVCFGCTGGQHRSVYCANQMEKLLKEKYPVMVEKEHVNLKS